MTKPKVFVSRRIPEEGLILLRKHCEVEISPHDRVLSKQEMIEGVKGKDALLCLLTDAVDAEVMDANPGLRVISNYAVGFNNVDVKAANERQIPVCNTPGVLTDTVADHAFALLMAISRRIPEANNYTKAGRYEGWAPLLFLGSDVFGKTLGIVGLGRIGTAVAKRAVQGFDMKVKYYDVSRNPEFEKEYGAEYGTLEEVLKESDYVTVHVPLLPQTRHLIGVKELNKMKKSAYLINTSRGPVIDEEALVHALRHNVIAGAAMDVFEDEPQLKPGLAELDNAITTPHIASATKETRGAMSTLAAENLLAVLEGKTPPHQVNSDKVKIGKGFIHPFNMSSGRVLKNKAELTHALENCEDHHFWHHVSEQRNDFATWVKDVFKDHKLAGALLQAKDRKEALDVLKGSPKKKSSASSGRKAKKKARKSSGKSKSSRKKAFTKPPASKKTSKKPKKKSGKE